MTTTLQQGQALKAEGQGQAESAAPDWTAAAVSWIESRAAESGTFTSDSLIAAVGLPTGRVGTNRNNAVGSAFSHASRTGLVLDTGKRVQSKRVPNHAAELTVWVGASQTTKSQIALSRALSLVVEAIDWDGDDLVGLLRVKRLIQEELDEALL